MNVEKIPTGYRVTVYDQPIAHALRLIPGSRFSGTDGVWFIDYRNISHREIMATDQKVQALERRYKKLQAEAILNEPQILGEIEPLPELTIELPVRRPLYGYQKPGVGYLLKNGGGVIVGDQPGLGKTTIASAGLLAGRVDDRFKMLPALIICPTTLKRKWQKELLEVTGYNAVILTDKLKNSWPRFLSAGMVDAVIVNYESIKKYFVQLTTTPEGEELKLKDIVYRPEVKLFRTVIIDEIHRCKDYKTQQAKYVKGLTQHVAHVWGLTGTALVNHPEDLIAQLSIINRLHEFGGLTRFRLRYCAHKEVDGKKIFPNLEELNYLLCQRCFFRREKKDVLKDLPDKTRQLVQVDITNRPEYDQAEKRFETYLRTYKGCTEADIARKMRAEMLVQMMALGEIAARGKMQAIKEWGDNLLAAGEKIVLFCDRQDIIEAVKKLWPKVLEISGQVTGDDRDRAVHLFQTSVLHRVIVLNERAGGVGIDLFAASHVGFTQLPWHYASLEQMEDRLHRNGQKAAVLSCPFIGVGTVDEYRWQKIQDKRAMAQTVHGGKDEIQEEDVQGLLDFFNRRKSAAKKSNLWE